MDPDVIETHTGMKVLTKDEYSRLQSDLETSKKDATELNSKVQEMEKMKKEIDDLKAVVAEKAATEAAAHEKAAAKDDELNKLNEKVAAKDEELKRLIAAMNETVSVSKEEPAAR